MVFVPHATTSINTVLRNLVFEHGNVTLYMSIAYSACENIILHCCEVTLAECVRIEVEFTVGDAELISCFRRTAEGLLAQKKSIRIALFDAVMTSPGVRFP